MSDRKKNLNYQMEIFLEQNLILPELLLFRNLSNQHKRSVYELMNLDAKLARRRIYEYSNIEQIPVDLMDEYELKQNENTSLAAATEQTAWLPAHVEENLLLLKSLNLDIAANGDLYNYRYKIGLVEFSQQELEFARKIAVANAFIVNPKKVLLPIKLIELIEATYAIDYQQGLLVHQMYIDQNGIVVDFNTVKREVNEMFLLPNKYLWKIAEYAFYDQVKADNYQAEMLQQWGVKVQRSELLNPHQKWLNQQDLVVWQAQSTSAAAELKHTFWLEHGYMIAPAVIKNTEIKKEVQLLQSRTEFNQKSLFDQIAIQNVNEIKYYRLLGYSLPAAEAQKINRLELTDPLLADKRRIEAFRTKALKTQKATSLILELESSSLNQYLLSAPIKYLLPQKTLNKLRKLFYEDRKNYAQTVQKVLASEAIKIDTNIAMSQDFQVLLPSFAHQKLADKLATATAAETLKLKKTFETKYGVLVRPCALFDYRSEFLSLQDNNNLDLLTAKNPNKAKEYLKSLRAQRAWKLFLPQIDCFELVSRYELEKPPVKTVYHHGIMKPYEDAVERILFNDKNLMYGHLEKKYFCLDVRIIEKIIDLAQIDYSEAMLFYEEALEDFLIEVDLKKYHQDALHIYFRKYAAREIERCHDRVQKAKLIAKHKVKAGYVLLPIFPLSNQELRLVSYSNWQKYQKLLATSKVMANSFLLQLLIKESVASANEPIFVSSLMIDQDWDHYEQKQRFFLSQWFDQLQLLEKPSQQVVLTEARKSFAAGQKALINNLKTALLTSNGELRGYDVFATFAVGSSTVTPPSTVRVQSATRAAFATEPTADITVGAVSRTAQPIAPAAASVNYADLNRVFVEGTTAAVKPIVLIANPNLRVFKFNQHDEPIVTEKVAVQSGSAQYEPAMQPWFSSNSSWLEPVGKTANRLMLPAVLQLESTHVAKNGQSWLPTTPLAASALTPLQLTTNSTPSQDLTLPSITTSVSPTWLQVDDRSLCSITHERPSDSTDHALTYAPSSPIGSQLVPMSTTTPPLTAAVGLPVLDQPTVITEPLETFQKTMMLQHKPSALSFLGIDYNKHFKLELLKRELISLNQTVQQQQLGYFARLKQHLRLPFLAKHELTQVIKQQGLFNPRTDHLFHQLGLDDQIKILQLGKKDLPAAQLLVIDKYIELVQARLEQEIMAIKATATAAVTSQLEPLPIEYSLNAIALIKQLQDAKLQEDFWTIIKVNPFTTKRRLMAIKEEDLRTDFPGHSLAVQQFLTANKTTLVLIPQTIQQQLINLAETDLTVAQTQLMKYAQVIDQHPYLKQLLKVTNYKQLMVVKDNYVRHGSDLLLVGAGNNQPPTPSLNPVVAVAQQQLLAPVPVWHHHCLSANTVWLQLSLAQTIVVIEPNRLQKLEHAVMKFHDLAAQQAFVEDYFSKYGVYVDLRETIDLQKVFIPNRFISLLVKKTAALNKEAILKLNEQYKKDHGYVLVLKHDDPSYACILPYHIQIRLMKKIAKLPPNEVTVVTRTFQEKYAMQYLLLKSTANAY